MLKKVFVATLLSIYSLLPLEADEIPLNLGFGPAVNYFPGSISEDQLFHYALKLDIYAVLDRQFIESHKSRIPKKYREILENKDEFYISYLFIPELLIISPKIHNTSMYGISFRPLDLGFDIIKGRKYRMKINPGLNLTYIYIQSDTLFNKSGSMNFLRPGINIKFENIFRISRKFLITAGIDTYFYIPQKLEDKSPIMEIGNIDESIWFFAQIYLLFNPRVNYNIKF